MEGARARPPTGRSGSREPPAGRSTGGEAKGTMIMIITTIIVIIDITAIIIILIELF